MIFWAIANLSGDFALRGGGHWSYSIAQSRHLSHRNIMKMVPNNKIMQKKTTSMILTTANSGVSEYVCVFVCLFVITFCHSLMIENADGF